MCVAAMLLAASCGQNGKKTEPKTVVHFKHYDITFVASGETNIVDSVYVENLVSGAKLAMSGSDILRLNDASEPVEEVPVVSDDEVRLENGKFIFNTTGNGVADVSIYQANGALITRKTVHLDGSNHYEIALPKVNESGVLIARLTAPGIDKSVTLTQGTQSATRDGGTRGGDNGKEAEMQAESTIANFADRKVVEMPYNAGELLRFTGKSGKMRTIVTNIPTLSHDITFDFYDCTDAAGYTYAVVKAGDLLWMAEDLRYVGNTKAPLLTQNNWSNKDVKDPFAVYPGFSTEITDAPCYYNYQGAKDALPDGWELPTASQIESLCEALGGMDVAGEALKMRGAKAWPSYVEGNDSISVGFLPLGYINKEGNLVGTDHSLHLTRTTKGGKPIYYELIDGKKELSMNKDNGIEDMRMAFTVRGCRPAPSAYNAIIDSFKENFFGDDPSLAQNPLTGEYITQHNGTDMVMWNHTNTYKPMDWYTVWPRDFSKGQWDENNNFIGTINTSNKDCVKLKAEHERCVRKAVVQYTANGYSRPIVVWFDREEKYEGGRRHADSRPSMVGSGNIHFDIYNDHSKNFEYEKSIQLNGFYNNEIKTADRWQCQHSDYFPFWCNYYFNRVLFEWKELMARQMSVACGDLTGDGNDEILVVMNKKAVLVDGATYKDIGTINDVKGGAMQVYTIGDVNGDKYNDIVMIGNGFDNQSSTVKVFLGGASKNAFERMKDGRADASETIPLGAYIDIKVGDVTGDGKANIVAYTCDKLNSSDANNNPTAKIYVYSFDNMSQPIVISEETSHFVYHRGVELVGFRGAGMPKDIVGTRQVWRIDDKEGKFKVVYDHPCKWKSGGMGTDEIGESYMPKDGMAVGDFLGNGTEQLVYLPHYIQKEGGQGGQGAFNKKCGTGGEGRYCDWCWTRIHSVSKNKMLYVENNTFKKREFGAHDDVDFLVIESTSANHSGKTSNFTEWREPIYSWSYALPLLSAPRSVFKYKSHSQSISEPRIYALLAAPPYFAGYEYQNTPSTTWGKSSSSSSGTTETSSSATSLIFGYEQELSVLGINLGGFEEETQLTWEQGISKDQSHETTYSTQYSILEDDGVVMLVTPYDTYTYECVSAPSEDALGTELTVSVPREPRPLLMSLTDYTRLRADNGEIPDLRRVFTHTPGDPFSYPDSKDKFPQDGLRWGEGDYTELIGTGSSSLVTRSIEINDVIGQSNSCTFNLDVKLVAKSGGAKVGAGYGYSEGKEVSYSVGNGFSIEGQVMSPKNYADITPFRWNVCWYRVNCEGQEFPVVNYSVKKN